MDSGVAPNIVQPNQVAFALNVTFRGSFPETRPPFNRLKITTTADLNTGVFQGAGRYQADEPEGSGIVFQKGGHLFRVQFPSEGAVVDDITPYENLMVLNDFTVPALGGTVDVGFNRLDALPVGENVVITGGTYHVDSISILGFATLSYSGGGTIGTTVSAGSLVFSGGTAITKLDINPLVTPAFIFQAENYLLIGCGTELPYIYDGATTRRSLGDSGTEIPPFYCGAYVNGRCWFVLTSRIEFMGGDLVGSSSGDPTIGRVDAVLKVTQNLYWNEGGAFTVPSESGLITAITGTVTLDTALGQGPVLLSTTNAIFSINAPPDATTWKNLSYPIQTVALKDYGVLSPYGLTTVNGDLWYRSQDGIRSFISAVRNFNVGWGNTAMSHEMIRVLDMDAVEMLDRCSTISFDNRLLVTCQPRSVDTGVVHDGMVVLNFDEVSGMFRKTAPAWDGLWTGIHIYQLVRCRPNGIERCFALCEDSEGFGIWEIERDGDFDTFIDTHGTLRTTPIQCQIETRSLTFSSPFDVKKLDFVELFVDHLSGSVDFSFALRPNQYPCWVPWATWTECNKVDRCDEKCGIPANYQPGYRPYMRTTTCPEVCLPGIPSPVNTAYEWQLQVGWIGKSRVKQIRAQAKQVLNSTMGECR